MDNDELIKAFQDVCYCGFLKKMDAPVSLCIHCKTLEVFMEKGYVQIPKDYKPKTKPVEQMMKTTEG